MSRKLSLLNLFFCLMLSFVVQAKEGDDENVVYRDDVKKPMLHGWYLAQSTGVSGYSIELPCPFRDVKVNVEAEKFTAYGLACTTNKLVFNAWLYPNGHNQMMLDAFEGNANKKDFSKITVQGYPTLFTKTGSTTYDWMVKTPKALISLTAIVLDEWDASKSVKMKQRFIDSLKIPDEYK